MGISKKGQDWYSVVMKHRENHKCPCQLEENAGKFCTFHGWSLSGCPNRTHNIHSTPEGDKLIKSRCTKYDENEKALPSTERGKRRRARRKSGE